MHYSVRRIRKLPPKCRINNNATSEFVSMFKFLSMRTIYELILCTQVRLNSYQLKHGLIFFDTEDVIGMSVIDTRTRQVLAILKYNDVMFIFGKVKWDEQNIACHKGVYSILKDGLDKELLQGF